MRFNPEIKYDTEELEQLISKGEGVQQDFKQSISSSRKIARTLAAFANNRGGKLLIGVKDSGVIRKKKCIWCTRRRNITANRR